MKTIQKITEFTELSFNAWEGEEEEKREIEVKVVVLIDGKKRELDFNVKETRSLTLHEGDFCTPDYTEEDDLNYELKSFDCYDENAMKIPFPGIPDSDLFEIIDTYYEQTPETVQL